MRSDAVWVPVDDRADAQTVEQRALDVVARLLPALGVDAITDLQVQPAATDDMHVCWHVSKCVQQFNEAPERYKHTSTANSCGLAGDVAHAQGASGNQ